MSLHLKITSITFWVLHSLLLSLYPAYAAYQPCPLLHAYDPVPSINANSAALSRGVQKLTTIFDGLVKTGQSKSFGVISPNTTSFSVVLFTAGPEQLNDSLLFHYEHTTPSPYSGSGGEAVTLDSVFPIGSLTQLFTVYEWLVAVGDASWNDAITKFIPELDREGNGKIRTPWVNITIGALAGQLSGLPSSSRFCHVNQLCESQGFIDAAIHVEPLLEPDTTPVNSNIAFQLLAIAMENYRSGHYQELIQHDIFHTLDLTSTGFLSTGTHHFGPSITESIGEPAAFGMYMSPSDLVKAGQAMLSSQLISPAATRRWLAAGASTSNLRNSVGRPWEIYHAGQYANSSILDVYTKTGSVDKFSSYFGLVPDFNVGFAILASDLNTAPDLNVYADIVSLALVELQALATQEVRADYAGHYQHGNSVASLNVTSSVIQTDPGLAVTALRINGTDVFQAISNILAIKPADLDFRLYPSNVKAKKPNTEVWLAVYQDKSAPVDADTPTCITWQNVAQRAPEVPSHVLFERDSTGPVHSIEIVDHSSQLRKVPGDTRSE